MKIHKELFDRQWVRITLSLCAAVLFYVCLSHINLLFIAIGQIWKVTYPVFIGLVIAYILNPLVRLIRKSLLRGMKRPKAAWGASVAVTIILVIVLLVLLLVALIPQVIKSIGEFMGNIGLYVEQLDGLLNNLTHSASQHNIDVSGITSFGQKILDTISTYLTKNSGGVLGTVQVVGSGVMNGVIGFILSIYFLLDKERLMKGAGRFNRLIMSEKHFNEGFVFWSRCNDICTRFIGFDIIDGLIIGLANCVFMMIAGMPYNALISVVVGVTNLAPTFGPLVGAMIGAFILLLVNPWYALAFLIFTICLQTVDGYILKPKLFGGTLGVPGLWILICIIVFGRMWGVAGILLSIPLAAILDFIYHDYILARLQRRHAKSEAAEGNVRTGEDRDVAVRQEYKPGCGSESGKGQVK